jgi:hypothetical protein
VRSCALSGSPGSRALALNGRIGARWQAGPPADREPLFKIGSTLPFRRPEELSRDDCFRQSYEGIPNPGGIRKQLEVTALDPLDWPSMAFGNLCRRLIRSR